MRMKWNRRVGLWKPLPVTHSAETSGAVSVMELGKRLDGRAVGGWRRDKVEEVKDEVSRSSSTSASDTSCFASNEGEGWDRLLKATSVGEGMEEVDVGKETDGWNSQEDNEESIFFSLILGSTDLYSETMATGRVKLMQY